MPWSASTKVSVIKHLRLLSIAALAWLWLPPAIAVAGTWKCTTADGGVAYVNNHLSDYRQCTRIAVPGVAPAAAAPQPAPAGEWRYRDTRAEEAPPALAAPAAESTRVLKGTVYRVERSDGVREYTNVRPGARGGKVAMLFHYLATCRACEVHSSIDWATVPLHLDRYAAAISAAAAEYGIDGGLLRALIHAESGFDAQAVSGKGAQGLAQLMPATARSLGVTDAFDPEQNIRGGARYLAGLLKDFDGNTRLATAAYNAGPGAVRKYGGVPPYPETRVYVDRVGILAQRYRAALHGVGAGAAVTAGATAAH